MQVHARISKEWRRRMVFMFIMLFGSGLWFLYDGYVAWPAEAGRHEILRGMAERMIEAGEVKDSKELLKDPALVRAWERYARENDLPPKVPKARSDGDLAGQRISAFVLLVASAIFAAWVAWNHRLSVRAEGDIVIGACGRRVHLDHIVEMDRSKWASKGIAYAIYEEDGRRRRLTLDDHKFLGCEAIILEAERRMAARAAAATPPVGESSDAPPAA